MCGVSLPKLLNDIMNHKLVFKVSAHSNPHMTFNGQGYATYMTI